MWLLSGEIVWSDFFFFLSFFYSFFFFPSRTVCFVAGFLSTFFWILTVSYYANYLVSWENKMDYIASFTLEAWIWLFYVLICTIFYFLSNFWRANFSWSWKIVFFSTGNRGKIIVLFATVYCFLSFSFFPQSILMHMPGISVHVLLHELMIILLLFSFYSI